MIYNKEDATPLMERILEENNATQFEPRKDGGVTLLGNGWTRTLSVDDVYEVHKRTSGRLEGGWRFIHKATYPRRSN